MLNGTDTTTGRQRRLQELREVAGTAAYGRGAALRLRGGAAHCRRDQEGGNDERPALIKALDSLTNVPTIVGEVSYTKAKHYNYFPIS